MAVMKMVPERLRPEVKPEKISDLEWEQSKCDKSPTGAHWFVPAPGGELECYFCEKFHTKVWGTGQRSKKRGGRPRKAKVKEGML